MKYKSLNDSFNNYYWKNMTIRFADFNGSTNREEYWMFTLWSFIVTVILSLISAGVLGAIYSFLVLIPQSAINVRRYHDLGMSGWYFFVFMLLFLVPFLNIIVLVAHLYFMCKKSINNNPAVISSARSNDIDEDKFPYAKNRKRNY